MTERLGISASTLSGHVAHLERKGYLVRTGGPGGGLTLVDNGEAVGASAYPLPRGARYLALSAIPQFVGAALREEEKRRGVPRELRRADAVGALLREKLG